jgi:hypothetical protein
MAEAVESFVAELKAVIKEQSSTTGIDILKILIAAYDTDQLTANYYYAFSHTVSNALHMCDTKLTIMDEYQKDITFLQSCLKLLRQLSLLFIIGSVGDYINRIYIKIICSADVSVNNHLVDDYEFALNMKCDDKYYLMQMLHYGRSVPGARKKISMCCNKDSFTYGCRIFRNIFVDEYDNCVEVAADIFESTSNPTNIISIRSQIDTVGWTEIGKIKTTVEILCFDRKISREHMCRFLHAIIWLDTLNFEHLFRNVAANDIIYILQNLKISPETINTFARDNISRMARYIRSKYTITREIQDVFDKFHASHEYKL